MEKENIEAEKIERLVEIRNTDGVSSIFGNFDTNLNTIQKTYNVAVICRGDNIKITGTDEKSVESARQAVRMLIKMAENNEIITEQTVRYVTTMLTKETSKAIEELADGAICITATGKPVRPKTLGQKNYVESISKNTIVLGIGPAGTGKTYLAVAAAVQEFRNRNIQKIILTRPAVEAGESLGFLPGDLQTKVDPYLRPLYDALFDMLGAEAFRRNMERGIIEVAPLAYMRGRTLDDAFIILDEAQNTTHEQLKMFLTRLGNNSKMVITGDITQIDLPSSKKSGLLEAMKILKNIEGIDIKRFSEKDVVRHRLVQDIIKAYEKVSQNA
jgi:phosphate starvation-inducible PhoH-like protein